MKKLKYISFVLLFALGCTSDFDEINTNPNAIRGEDASARYFITNPQYQLFAPNRFPYWRAHLIHADRFAGQFTFGFTGCWWTDELGYSYSSSYTDAAFGWLDGYFGGLDNFMRLTAPEGEFPNEYMYAVGKIMRALYFQMFTDIWGEIPYTETGDPDINLPKFDTQETIYQGLIAELKEAMTTIGAETKTGDGLEDLAENDIYFGGDLQAWKKLANSMRLRIATRAYGKASWADTEITAALSDPTGFLGIGESCLMEKDNVISQWASAAYADVYYNFGTGSDFNVSDVVINNLQDNADPRLSKYATTAPGGTYDFVRADDPDGTTAFDKKMAFIENAIDAGTNGNYIMTDDGTTVTFTVDAETYYIGQPVRLGGKIYDYAAHGFWSKPADIIIQRKGEGQPIFPEIVFTGAEAEFLQAEAAVNGFTTSGSANQHYQNGLTEAMKIWGVGDTEIADFLANSPMGSLQGTTAEQLEQIAVQRWLAAFTDGFEAWAIVRKTGFPAELYAGVSDPDIHGLGDINGLYPQRMRYGNQAYNNNGTNLAAAIARQGPDAMDVKLWWAK